MCINHTRNSGFTVLEILIALVVLSFGLLGILAVFPIGIQKTGEVIQDTISAIVAESVRDSIELGLNRARIMDENENIGFIYLGEGVKKLLEDEKKSLPAHINNIANIALDYDKTAAYWVQLPIGKDKKYLYPRKDSNDFEIGPRTPAPRNNPRVLRVFPVGADVLKIVDGIDPDDKSVKLTPTERRDAERDPIHHYSYAFTLEEAMIDTNGDDIPDSTSSDHSLYKLIIYVYRNFPAELLKKGNQDAAFANHNHQPIQIFTYLVSF
ncbi:MAG: prepilin-type N-terminal cleavage/methylation domain-containing protein [Planctomycetota bacterium]